MRMCKSEQGLQRIRAAVAVVQTEAKLVTYWGKY